MTRVKHDGRWLMPEGKGLDAAYGKQPRDYRRFETDPPKPMTADTGDKDPHHEFAQPGSSEGVITKTAPVGMNQGNRKPDGSTYREGQQAGTHGGQRSVAQDADAAEPSTPRADAEERRKQSGYIR